MGSVRFCLSRRAGPSDRICMFTDIWHAKFARLHPHGANSCREFVHPIVEPDKLHSLPGRSGHEVDNHPKDQYGISIVGRRRLYGWEGEERRRRRMELEAR